MNPKDLSLAGAFIFTAIVTALVSCSKPAPADPPADQVNNPQTMEQSAGDSIPGWPRGIREVIVVSSYDQTRQPALFWAPPGGSRESRPLVVALHTWSGDYLQDNSVPYWEYCLEHDWVFIHPNFRGPNFNSMATGSPAATEDILDAVAFARREASVDTNRIYLIGASGGGHMALLTAGRTPEVWAAVSAWVPVTDLVEMYRECKEEGRNNFVEHLLAACGGAPGKSAEIDNQYRLRSPLSVLAQAMGVPVEISSGIHDGHDGRPVPISHALRAFNVLAQANGMPDKVLAPGLIDSFVTCEQVPPELAHEAGDDPAYGDRTVLFRRYAGPARVTIFEGAHEKIAGAAMAWLAAHRKNDR